MAADDPKRYLASMSKAARAGRIFVDYLRNNRTNTSIAAYSIRAREDAPVSVPISWDELTDVDPRAFTMVAVLARMKKMKKDPWAAYWKTDQSIRSKSRR
jgi:bifunctional non-homologous end joining protein LigD